MLGVMVMVLAVCVWQTSPEAWAAVARRLDSAGELDIQPKESVFCGSHKLCMPISPAPSVANWHTARPRHSQTPAADRCRGWR